MTQLAIENVSRRAILAGIAWTGGLALAVQLMPQRGALAQAANK
jgi:hypothetical protein